MPNAPLLQTHLSTQDHDDKDSVVFDQAILSLCDKMVGTFFSSMTNAAVWRSLRSGRDVSYVQREGYCIRSPVPEAVWPQGHMLDIYNGVPAIKLTAKLIGDQLYARLLNEFGIPNPVIPNVSTVS